MQKVEFISSWCQWALSVPFWGHINILLSYPVCWAKLLFLVGCRSRTGRVVRNRTFFTSEHIIEVTFFIAITCLSTWIVVSSRFYHGRRPQIGIQDIHFVLKIGLSGNFCISESLWSGWLTACQHSWIINECCANTEKYAQDFVQIVAVSVPVKFRLCSITGNTRMTRCQHSWIINELCINTIKHARNCVQLVALTAPSNFASLSLLEILKWHPVSIHEWLMSFHVITRWLSEYLELIW